jgi:alpha-beta hydrolase superfamily lysophospholipase
MHDLIKLIDLCNKKDWFRDIRKDLPILLIAGNNDPVGNYGKGVKEVYNKLISRGADAEIKLYEGFRHEIHNDYCFEEVMTDILNFIS